MGVSEIDVLFAFLAANGVDYAGGEAPGQPPLRLELLPLGMPKGD
jgi:hypothetical protein